METIVGLSVAAATFDPEAATRAYLTTVDGAARAKSDAYFVGSTWLLLWGTLVAIAVDLVILATGLSARFRDWAERRTRRGFLQSLLYALPYGLAVAVLAFPWAVYSRFVRERQYDFMNLSFADWLGEQAIQIALGIVIGGLAIALILWGVRRAPRTWWVWGTGIAGAFIVLMVMIAPVFIAPLFNDYRELPAGPVRERIVAMAEAQQVPADNIYLFDQSKQHKRISANVSGLGPTIRISLNDNLLQRTTLPETAAVMGHELGHYKLNHVPTLALFFALAAGVAFFIASRAVPGLVGRFGPRWRLRGIDDVAAWPVYSIVISAIFLLLTPVTNTIVRVHESQADAYGLDVAREPDGFATTALKLGEYRKLEPSPIEEFLFHDHPSGRTRVRMAMEWKARALAGE